MPPQAPGVEGRRREGLPVVTDEQTKHLDRVSDNIAPLILRFARSRLELNVPEFQMHELHAYVAEQARAAPASADRVLRALRQLGRLDYRCIDRGRSRYRILSVKEAE